jgi:hypothetical protein
MSISPGFLSKIKEKKKRKRGYDSGGRCGVCCWFFDPVDYRRCLATLALLAVINSQHSSNHL